MLLKNLLGNPRVTYICVTFELLIMQNEIRQTWFFRQSPHVVWEYLTKPALIEQWLGATDFQPIVGHKFRFISPYGNDSFCEVLELKPFTKLSYSWRKNSVKDNKAFDSKVFWTLIPKENGVELQLVHNSFAVLEDLVAHEKGWNMVIKERLLNFITDSKVI